VSKNTYGTIGFMDSVILARGGSVSIPNKNSRNLGGKSLTSWTSQFAHSHPLINKVILSTDSSIVVRKDIVFSDFLESFKNLKVDKSVQVADRLYLHKRSIKFSDNEAKSADAVINCIESLNLGIEANSIPILLLQPTSPFRRFNELFEIYELYNNFKVPIFSAHELDSLHPLKVFQLDSNGGLHKDTNLKALETARQILPKFYAADGAYYLTTFEILKRYRTFILNTSKVYIREKTLSINIDNLVDLKIARKNVKRLNFY
jgi:CMP-N,N'-diacetyllegionaminic acid synthase